MRIVFVNRFYAPDHSATSQMLTDLAVALAKGGDEVHVVTSRLLYDDPAARLSVNETLDGVAVHRVRTSTFGRRNLAGRAIDYLSFYITASLLLFRLIRRGDIVVAKTDPPLVSIPVGWVVRLRKARQVNWLQDLFPEVATVLGVRMAQGVSGKLLARLRDRSLHVAARNVVPGRLMQDRLSVRGIDPGSIVVIPNWADGAAVQPVAHAANPLRDAWGLADKFVVGYSGNLGRAHEFQTIVDAALVLRPESDIVFLIIGGGAGDKTFGEPADPSSPNIIRKPYQRRELLAQSLGMIDVHLVSLRPEMEGLVVPSKFYGIAAAGRPTIFIGDRDGEIGALVRRLECGIAVIPSDAGGLADAIVLLREDVALQARMGANARNAFNALYEKDIAVESWRKLLTTVAQTEPGIPRTPAQSLP